MPLLLLPQGRPKYGTRVLAGTEVGIHPGVVFAASGFWEEAPGVCQRGRLEGRPPKVSD